jgi:hypothetical protein
MKTSLLTVTLLALLVLNTRGFQAQASGLYYYGTYWDVVQYQQYLPHQQHFQQHDPYYELHVMHYQLYLQRFQPYQYSPCCYIVVTIPQTKTTNLRRQTRASAQTEAAVTPLPQAVSPLPQAVGPLPRAVSSLPNTTSRR